MTLNLTIARGTNFSRFCRFSKIFLLTFHSAGMMRCTVYASSTRSLNGSAPVCGIATKRLIQLLSLPG
jgi:hypothetical protein